MWTERRLADPVSGSGQNLNQYAIFVSRKREFPAEFTGLFLMGMVLPDKLELSRQSC